MDGGLHVESCQENFEAYLASQWVQVNFAITSDQSNIAESTDLKDCVNFKSVKSEGGPLNFRNGEKQDVKEAVEAENLEKDEKIPLMEIQVKILWMKMHLILMKLSSILFLLRANKFNL